MRHDKFIQVSWHIFATTTVITLLSSIFVFSITPIYRATAYLPKQNPDDLVLVSSAVFLSSFVQDELVRFHDYEQFQRSEPIFSGQIVSILKENISFSSLEDEYSWVGFESPHPVFAADLVNLIARYYLDRVSSLNRTDSASAKLPIERQDAKGAVITFESQLLTLSSDLNRIENKIRTADTLLANERVKLKVLQMLVERSKPSRQFDPSVMADAKLSSMVSSLEKLRKEKSTIANRYGSRHSAMVAIETKIASANLDLEQRIVAVRKNQEREYEDAQRQSNGLEADLKILTRERAQILAKRAALVGDAKMANQSTSIEQKRIRFSEAAVPVVPIYPDKPKMIGSVFAVTLLIVAAIRLLMVRIANKS